MDRESVYRDQLPLETHVLLGQRNAYEGLGLLAKDIIGDVTSVAGFPCTPTAPASFAVRLGPGRIYALQELEPTAWGQVNGQGGVPADLQADHRILKMGKLRDTMNLQLEGVETPGQSMVWLIQAAFQEVDQAAQATQFWNSQNPQAPLSVNVSRRRLDKAVISLKPGVAAPTGTEVAPAVDAGYVPLWLITVAYGQADIQAADIVEHPGRPVVNPVGGGGGGGLAPWTVVNANTNLVAGQRYIVNPAGPGVQLTLPPNPNPSDEIGIKGKFVANNVLILRNGKTIEGAADNLNLNKDYLDFNLVYDGATWRV